MKLADYLKRNAISRQELADKSGLSVATINRLATGVVKSPNAKTRRALAMALSSLVGTDISVIDVADMLL